ncbi:hypothetical protein ScPMuIL_010265, partial [Solemya velum]
MCPYGSVVTFMILVAFASASFDEPPRLQQIVDHPVKCYVGDLPISECSVNVDKSYVPSGSRCLLKSGDDIVQPIVCQEGNWINPTSTGTDTTDAHYRLKRGIAVVSGVVEAFAAVGSFFCDLFCGDDSSPAQQQSNKPPVLECPNIQPQTCPEGSTSVVVTWEMPRAFDPEQCDLSQNIAQIAGKKSGSEFEEGSHHISFQVTDSHGNLAHCSIRFDVEVITCPRPTWPPNGIMDCSGENHAGSTCKFTCNTGHELEGESILRCGQNGHYNGSTPTCSRVRCEKPPNPKNGEAFCNREGYGSVCWTKCEKGYAPTDRLSIECLGDKKWSGRLPPCEDKEPPKIKCPPNKRATADKSDTAVVNWKKPTATDNSGGNVTVELISTGYGPGSRFPLGSTLVSYRAIDETGNISPTCTMEIVVETFSCAPPVHSSEYLVTECAPEDRYRLGTSCSLSCLANLPLIGSNKITCTESGLWTRDGTDEPYCEKVKCPHLTAPNNGALACDAGIAMEWCSLLCNEHFDISPWLPRTFRCGRKGTWNPPEIPNCSEKRNPTSMNLPSKFHYYTGTCGDNRTNEEIKKKFMALLGAIQQTKTWNELCNEISCNISRVTVICGEIINHHDVEKRSVESGYTISFNINSNIVNLTSENITSTEKYLHQIADFIKNETLTGNMEIDGLVTHEDSFSSASAKWNCPKGQSSDPKKFYNASCVGCPVGTYYDDQLDKCIGCPLGTYRETELNLNCTACPSGKSTSKQGSINSTSCKDICRPGSYSPTGLAPCSPCPVGKYQSADMAHNCIECPAGKMTENSSGSAQSDCQTFDIRLDAITTLSTITRPATSEGWTLSVWLVWFVGKGNVVMNVGDTKLNISLQSIAVETQTTTANANLKLSIGSWSHVAITTTQSGELSVFVNGDTVIGAHNMTLSPVTQVELSSYGEDESEVGLSGFSIIAQPIAERDIAQLAASCNSSHENTIFTSRDLLYSTRGSMDIVIPAECDEIDDCKVEPCGHHECENRQNGYICHCSGDVTGKNCEIPPDYCIGHRCQNGATCITGDVNYTCDCLPGYYGKMCEDAPVNGQWCPWTKWSTCDAACGGGQRTRQRSCDCPAPDEHGLPCQGQAHDNETCNTQTCPPCEPPTPPSNSYWSCDVRKGTKYCNLTCDYWYPFRSTSQPRTKYVCGIETGGQLEDVTDGSPLGHLPECSRVVGPKRLTANMSASYKDLPCTNIEEAREEVMNRMKELCDINNVPCEIEITMGGCVGKKRKSRTPEEINVNIRLSTSELSGDLKNKTDTEQVNHLVQNITGLVKVVAALKNDSQSYLAVTIKGKTYQVDAGSWIEKGGVVCPAGTTRVGALCAVCPAGTMYEDKRCILCKRGTYQDETGQSACKICPKGTTTAISGADKQTHCEILATKTEATECVG